MNCPDLRVEIDFKSKSSLLLCTQFTPLFSFSKSLFIVDYFIFYGYPFSFMSQYKYTLIKKRLISNRKVADIPSFCNRICGLFPNMLFPLNKSADLSPDYKFIRIFFPEFLSLQLTLIHLLSTEKRAIVYESA